MDTDNLLRLLIAHHSSHEAEGLLNILRKAGYATRPTYIDSAMDLAETLEKGKWDLVLSADRLKDGDLKLLMTHFTSAQKDMPVIVVSEVGDEDLMVSAMQLGARDCIARDQPRHLVEAVRRELTSLEQRRERRLAESALREYKRRNNALLAASREAVAFVLDGMHIHANNHYARIFGLEEPSEFAQLPLMDLVAKADRPLFRDFLKSQGRDGEAPQDAIELTALRAGEPFSALFNVTQSVYEGEACLQLVVTSLEPSDQTLTKPAAGDSQLSQSSADPVERLLDVLEERVVAAIKGQRRSCLIYLELDNFGEVRRGLGVAESHQLVGDVTATVRKELGDETLVTRCGDSAIALLIDDPDLRASTALGRRLRRIVSESKAESKGHSLALTCSLGVVAITELTPSGQEAFNWAVDACQKAAGGGGDRMASHEWTEKPSLEARTSQLTKTLKKLFKRKRNVLGFRPIVGLHGHRREFYEIIPQVLDEAGIPYPTDQVYRAAEDSNLSANFDRWMLDRVVDLIAEMTHQGRDIYFILGFTDLAMRDENRVLSVAKALKNANLEGERLIFRLSEAAASTNVRPARSFVTGLHKLNCKVALTHFGSGLNPFRILEHVDADYLAFDAAFVQDILRNPESRQAVELLCEETRQRSKFTIAPGVRDADTLAVLWQCGVDYASGDYLQEAGTEMSYDFQAEA